MLVTLREVSSGCIRRITTEWDNHDDFYTATLSQWAHAKRSLQKGQVSLFKLGNTLWFILETFSHFILQNLSFSFQSISFHFTHYSSTLHTVKWTCSNIYFPIYSPIQSWHSKTILTSHWSNYKWREMFLK